MKVKDENRRKQYVSIEQGKLTAIVLLPGRSQVLELDSLDKNRIYSLHYNQPEGRWGMKSYTS